MILFFSLFVKVLTLEKQEINFENDNFGEYNFFDIADQDYVPEYMNNMDELWNFLGFGNPTELEKNGNTKLQIPLFFEGPETDDMVLSKDRDNSNRDEAIKFSKFNNVARLVAVETTIIYLLNSFQQRNTFFNS